MHLKGQDGFWISDLELLKTLVVKFFSTLYLEESLIALCFDVISEFLCLLAQELFILGGKTFVDKIKEAIFHKRPFKALETNRLKACSCQKMRYNDAILMLFYNRGF